MHRFEIQLKIEPLMFSILTFKAQDYGCSKIATKLNSLLASLSFRGAHNALECNITIMQVLRD
jgi:hypothetical protein